MTNELEIKKYELDKKYNLAEQKLEMAANVKVGNETLATITMLSDKFSRAGELIPKEFRDSPEKCFVAIYKGASLGLDAFTSLQRIAVVNGRATIWGDTALALVRKSGLLETFQEEILEENNKIVAICTVRRKGDAKDHTEKFSQDDAVKAGLWGKNVWNTHPKRMLKYKARAFALRDMFADILDGLHFKEEMEGEQMIDVSPKPKMRYVVPTQEEQEEETISSEQAFELEELAVKSGDDLAKICKIYGIETIIQLPASKFEILKKKLGGKNANS